MADKKELDPGFKRNSRVIVIAIVVAAVAVGAVVTMMARKAKAPLPDSQVVEVREERAAPRNSTENPKFNELVEAQNKAKSEEAKKAEDSFMPSFPSRSAALPEKKDPENELMRAQRDEESRRIAEKAQQDAAKVREAQEAKERDAQTAASAQAQVLANRWGFVGANTAAGTPGRGIAVLEPQQPKVVPVAETAAKPTQVASAGSSSGTSSAVKSAGKGKLITAAGDEIFPGVIEVAIDTDNPAKVLGMVTGGKLSGARIYGKATRTNETVNIEFDRMAFRGRSYSITAFAIDQDSMRSAIAGDVDRKYLERYGVPVVAAMINAWAGAKAQTGSTDTLSIAGVTTSRPTPTNEQVRAAAIQAGAATVVQNMQKEQHETRVQTPRNFPVGIVFSADVVEAS